MKLKLIAIAVQWNRNSAGIGQVWQWPENSKSAYYVSFDASSLNTSLCLMSSSRLPGPRTLGPGNLTATRGFGLLGPAPNLAFY